MPAGSSTGTGGQFSGARGNRSCWTVPKPTRSKTDPAIHLKYCYVRLSSLATAFERPEKMSATSVAISAGNATSGTESTATAIRTAASRRLDASLALRAIKCSSPHCVIRIRGKMEKRLIQQAGRQFELASYPLHIAAICGAGKAEAVSPIGCPLKESECDEPGRGDH